MLIVGLTGPIGHGKSTFAKTLLDLEPSAKRIESSAIIAEVADLLHSSTSQIPNKNNIDSINNWLKPLPAILQETVHAPCNFKQIKIELDDMKNKPKDYEKLLIHIDNINQNNNLIKAIITPKIKDVYRPILQWLGGYLVKRVDSKIWFKEIIRRASVLANDGAKLCLIGGLRFPTDGEVVRSAGGKIIRVYRPGFAEPDAEDPTEKERQNIVIDCTVVNDGDIVGLKKCSQLVLNDLNNNKLQKQYVVSKLYQKPAA